MTSIFSMIVNVVFGLFGGDEVSVESRQIYLGQALSMALRMTLYEIDMLHRYEVVPHNDRGRLYVVIVRPKRMVWDTLPNDILRAEIELPDRFELWAKRSKRPFTNPDDLQHQSCKCLVRLLAEKGRSTVVSIA